MKRVLSSLTKIPLLLFLGCFFGAVLLGSPLKCYAQTLNSEGILSQQNGDNSNSIDQTMTAFENATQEWKAVFLKYAEELFWLLAPIGMVWRFGQIALKGEGLTEALAELVRFTIFIGFYYWLLENGTQITQAIVQSMEKMAGTAAHTSQGLDASSILNLGLDTLGDILYNNYKIFSLNESHDFGAIFDVALGIFFACLCAVIAIHVLLAVLAVWFLMYAGIFILGFGSTSWTSDMAINYFRTVLVASIRLATIILIVGVCQNVIETIAQKVQAGIAYSSNNFMMMTELIISALMMYLLIKTIPELLGSLAKGVLGLNNPQPNPANAYANALMQQQLYASSSAGGGGGGGSRLSRSAAEIEAEQKAQQLAETRMAQRETARAEERARAATTYTKPESPKPPPTTSRARTYIVENMTEEEKEAMYHIPASQIYIPPPGYVGDSSDVGGPKNS
ncbi:MAG: P-type conjugative transfer protein TrbL [Acetobacter sp.]|nr:P-type conjugative transfer protein TrbL [Acetobacter sp.]